MYLIRRPNPYASTMEWQEFLAEMMELPQDDPGVRGAVLAAQDELDLRSGKATEAEISARKGARLDESFRLLREAQAAERKMKKGE
jgi:hypothetical protein